MSAGGSAHAQTDPPLPSCGPVPEALSPLGRADRLGTIRNAFPDVGATTSVEVGRSVAYQQTFAVFGPIMEVSGPFTISGKLGLNNFTLVVPAEPLIHVPYKLGLRAPNSDFRYERDKKPRTFGKPDADFAITSPTTLSVAINYGLGTAQFDVPDARIVLKKCVADRTPEFRQELVYSGVAKGVVSLTYREFSQDLARPAFTQILTYDLADGKEIGFRGARIRIDEASNVALRYTVLAPLGGAR